SAPLLALVAPDLVPGPIMLSSLVLSLASAVRERASIDRSGVALALAGRLPGVALGASALAWLPEHTMNVVFGVLVLSAVALSISGPTLPRNPRTLAATGFVSGGMGTMPSLR